MAMEEVKETIQSVLVMPANIEQLKPEEKECLRRFIAAKDVVHFSTSLVAVGMVAYRTLVSGKPHSVASFTIKLTSYGLAEC